MLNQIDARLAQASAQPAAALRAFRAQLTYNPRNVEDLGAPQGLRDRLLDALARMTTSYQAPTAAQQAEAADFCRSRCGSQPNTPSCIERYDGEAMNVDKMTERVSEGLNAAYTRALSEHNTQTTPEHMLAAMLDQERGIAPDVLAKAGADVPALTKRLDEAIGRLPRLKRFERRQRAQVTASRRNSRAS